MRRTYLLNVLVAILLVVGLLVPSAATALSSTTVKLWIGKASMSVNGVQQLIDVQGTKPVIVAGRTLVPIRAVIEAFGGFAVWEASTRKATVTLGKDSLDLWIDKPQASLNGTALAIDAANPAVVPVITNGRTMLPLRFVAESLGIDVQYDATTQMITLVYSPVVTPPVMYVLTVITVGNGTATPATGTTYASGTVVTLAATPAAGCTFTNWSGDLSSATNPTIITMDAAKTVTATFAITPPVVISSAPLTLTVLSPKNGEVWIAGTTHTITWAVSGDMSKVKDFSLEYLGSDGHIKPLGVNSIVPNTVRSFSWTVPNDPSPSCCIYVSAEDIFLIKMNLSGSFAITPPVVTLPSSFPTIASKDELIQFLTTYFSVCDTSIGPTNFAFEVSENTETIEPYDYWIQEKYNTTFFHDLQYNNTITTEMNHKVCGELKQFQEKLAKAAIAAMPSKKLYGCYYDSYYRYPSLRLDLIAFYYYSWMNYSPNDLLTKYADARITGFSWWPLIDDQLER
jgi:hypothetical protein